MTTNNTNNTNKVVNFLQFISTKKQDEFEQLLEIVGDEKFVPADLLADVNYEQLRNSRMIECQRLLEKVVVPAFANAGIDIMALDDVSEYSTPYRVLRVHDDIHVTMDYYGDDSDGKKLSVTLMVTTENGGKGFINLFSTRLGDGVVTVSPRAMENAREVFQNFTRWSVLTRALIMKIVTGVVEYFNNTNK